MSHGAALHDGRSVESIWKVVATMLRRAFGRIVRWFIRLIISLFGPTKEIQIFINYRLDDIDGGKRARGVHRDTNPTTRLITDTLRKIVGDHRNDMGSRVAGAGRQQNDSDRIYLDADDLPPGQDWRTELRKQHRRSSAVVSLIGPNWLKPIDRHDGWGPVVRLWEPKDALRSELEVALARGVPVIPVFVNRQQGPSVQELPPQLQNFHGRQGTALQISEADLAEFQSHFGSDRHAVDGTNSTAPFNLLEKSYAKQLQKIVATTREKIDEAQYDEWLEKAKDVAVMAAALVVACGVLAYLLPRLPSELWAFAPLLCAIVLLVTPLVLPVIISWKCLRMIYCIRKEEPGFGIFSAYFELLSCYRQSFGSWDVKLVSRVRTEAAMISPPPKEVQAKQSENSQDERAAREQARESLLKWKKQLRETVNDALGGKKSRDHTVVRPELRIATCFELNSARERISRYLTLQKQLWPRDRQSLYCWIVIEQGFLAPQFLVAGLQDRFDQDWRPSLDWYGTAVELQDSAVSETLRQFQAFQFLCWLTWGPSIPLCTCPQWHVRHAGREPGDAPLMLQFGYGDENNSWLIIDDTKLKSPLKQFLSRSLRSGAAQGVQHPGGSGRHTSAWAYQCEAKVIPTAIDYVKSEMCEAQKGAPSDLALRVLTIGRLEGSHVYENRRIYQAYVWVMFVMCNEHGEALFPKQPWHGLVPFFTHGNIAEPGTYQFIREEVARKALDCLHELAKGSPATYFRYACASDHSNCNHPLEFTPPSPTMLDLLHQGHGSRLDNSTRPRVLLPKRKPQPATDSVNHYEEEETFAGFYAACHLPERIDDFYRHLEDSQQSAKEVAEARQVSA